MTAKEYLNGTRELGRRIQYDIDERNRLRKMAESLASPGFGEEHNPNHPTDAPYVHVLEMVDEMERRIGSEIKRLLEMRKERFDLIQLVEDSKEKFILLYRYIHDKSWEEIAREMNCTVRWVYKLHSRALHSFEKVLRERVR